MALVKSIVGAEAIYRGSHIVDVDNGEPTYGRVVENAQADVAAVHELISTSYLDNSLSRSAVGRGCPLRVPIVNQSVAWEPEPVIVDATFIQYPFVLHVLQEPQGAPYVFTILGDDALRGFDPQVLIHEYTDHTTDAVTVVLEWTPLPATFGARSSYSASIALEAGTYVAWFRVKVSDVSGVLIGDYPDKKIWSFHVNRHPVSQQFRTLPNGIGQNVTVPTPSGTDPLVFQQMDEALFVDDDGISGWMVDRIDKNINALMEYVTGAPAGTNAAYTHTESAATNPTTSRFLSGTGKGFANEEGVRMQLHSVCFGGTTSLCEYLLADSTAPELAKPTGWAPFAVADGTSGSPIAVCKTRSFLPDLADSVDVLVVFAQQTNYADGLASMMARVRIGSVTSSYEAIATITNAPEVDTGVEGFGYAFFSGLDVSSIRDSSQTIFVDIYYDGAGTYTADEIMFRCAVLSLGVWRS